MAVGTSGRIVIDIDPGLKRRLHAALAAEGRSLKEWFLDRCARYLAERGQRELFDERSERASVETEARQ
jgi:hypothetical protein